MFPPEIEHTAIRTLLIEDSTADSRLIREFLGRREESRNFEVHVSTTLDEALGRLESEDWDVVLCDLSLPDSSGLATFESVRSAFDKGPVMVLSGYGDRRTAIEALQKGAEDYLVKGSFDDELLRRAILYALERRRLRVEAEENRRLASLGRLTSAVAHHVNNVLMGISTYAELGVRFVDQPERVQQAFEGIRRSIGRGKSLIAEVLSLSRMKTPQLTELAVGEWLAAVIPDVAKAAGADPSRMTIDVETGLRASFDPEQMRTLLTHLVRNAREASEKVSVNVRATDEEGELHLCIEDDGPGIAQKHLPNVFEPLYSTRPSSHGLGLTIVRQIAAAHGGSAEIESKEGDGTAVSVMIPLARTVSE